MPKNIPYDKEKLQTALEVLHEIALEAESVLDFELSEAASAVIRRIEDALKQQEADSAVQPAEKKDPKVLKINDKNGETVGELRLSGPATLREALAMTFGPRSVYTQANCMLSIDGNLASLDTIVTEDNSTVSFDFIAVTDAKHGN